MNDQDFQLHYFFHPLNTCETCIHWIASNRDGDNICHPLDPATYEPMKTSFQVRECRHPKLVRFERPVERNGFAVADGSHYWARLCTGPDFGCVRHESGADTIQEIENLSNDVSPGVVWEQVAKDIEPLGIILGVMIRIPGGTFTMGGDMFSSEKPPHEVTVQPFYIGKFPVTQAQWKAVMGNNPSRFKGDNQPVTNVSWYDAKDFCKRLSQMTGKAYRLPTEAEWEYACRAGTTTNFAFGDSLSSDQANFNGRFPSVQK